VNCLPRRSTPPRIRQPAGIHGQVAATCVLPTPLGPSNAQTGVVSNVLIIRPRMSPRRMWASGSRGTVPAKSWGLTGSVEGQAWPSLIM
jgi:hypothetical protein